MTAIVFFFAPVDAPQWNLGESGIRSRKMNCDDAGDKFSADWKSPGPVVHGANVRRLRLLEG